MSKNYPSFVCYPTNRENFQNATTSQEPTMRAGGNVTQGNAVQGATVVQGGYLPNTDLGVDAQVNREVNAMNSRLPLGFRVIPPTNPRVGPDGAGFCIDDTCFDTTNMKNLLKTLVVLAKQGGEYYKNATPTPRSN